VESILCYSNKVWTINAEMKTRLNALEMDYLQRYPDEKKLEIM